MGKLTALKITKLAKPGRYSDGAGLWLQVSKSGSKAWLLRFMRAGRARAMGLGPLHTVSLADARERARRERQKLLDGVDPIEARRAVRVAAISDAARTITFQDCAKKYIAAHEAGWKNSKSAAQWKGSLAGYVYPVFGRLPVREIDTGLVLRALKPIWNSKPETASRVRGRMERIIDWAKVMGYREGPNPATWNGHLKLLLPSPRSVKAVQHLPALPYQEIPELMSELREWEGITARALELTILTSLRTSEVLGARWSEFNTAERVWVVPAERMKGRKGKPRDHRVPLSDRALQILDLLPHDWGNEFVFPLSREGSPIPDKSMLSLLREIRPMAGWRFKGNGLDVTLFAGPDFQTHRLTPDDLGNQLRGSQVGLRVGGDLWYQPNAAFMTTVSVSFSTIGLNYWTRAAGGWHALGMLWIGPEVLALGGGRYHQVRAGMHVTGLRTWMFEWSGGFGYVRDSDNRDGLYGRFGLLTKL